MQVAKLILSNYRQVFLQTHAKGRQLNLYPEIKYRCMYCVAQRNRALFYIVELLYCCLTLLPTVTHIIRLEPRPNGK